MSPPHPCCGCVVVVEFRPPRLLTLGMGDGGSVWLLCMVILHIRRIYVPTFDLCSELMLNLSEMRLGVTYSFVANAQLCHFSFVMHLLSVFFFW